MEGILSKKDTGMRRIRSILHLLWNNYWQFVSVMLFRTASRRDGQRTGWKNLDLVDGTSRMRFIPLSNLPTCFHCCHDEAAVANMASRRKVRALAVTNRHFSAGALVQLEAVDTATGRNWDLRKRNLYLRTRQIGSVTEIDRTVAKTAHRLRQRVYQHHVQVVSRGAGNWRHLPMVLG